MLGNPALVGHREIHTFALRAIAQRRVVDFNSLRHKTFPPTKESGVAQKVVRTTAGYRILWPSLVSFTPGFSQVNWAFPITRMKPGVNENLNLPFVQKQGRISSWQQCVSH